MRDLAPIGHGAVLDGLWNAARAGRLAHALLFSGPEGVGKFLAAERLATGLLCARGSGAPGSPAGAAPCGTCGPCKRVRADAHPDLFVIDPLEHELESIPIAWVTPRSDGPAQTIEQFLSLRALEGGWRVVLVREADRLVEEAQNALLKTLEEPGDAALLVLVTARPERLLPTIRSRVVRVPFSALDPADAVAALVGAGVAAPRAEALARLSGGAPGFALALENAGLAQQLELVNAALEPGADPFRLGAAVFEVEGDFGGGTATAVARARARTFLDLCARVVLDGLRHAAGVPEAALAHGRLAARAGARGEAALSHLLDRILAARQDVDLNLAPDAAVERALCAFELPSATR